MTRKCELFTTLKLEWSSKTTKGKIVCIWQGGGEGWGKEGKWKNWMKLKWMRSKWMFAFLDHIFLSLMIVNVCGKLCLNMKNGKLSFYTANHKKGYSCSQRYFWWKKWFINIFFVRFGKSVIKWDKCHKSHEFSSIILDFMIKRR